MRFNKRFISWAVAIAAAAILTACGGGGGGGGAVAPGPVADPSVAFFSAVAAIAAGTSDTTEPVSIDGIAAASSDTAEPVAL